MSKSYYTHRDRDPSKRELDAEKAFAETSESKYRKSHYNSDSMRHCESTKVSDKKYLLYNNNQNDAQRILHRNLIMKHSALFNNGSQTVRNHDNREEGIFNESSSDTGIGRLLSITHIDDTPAPSHTNSKSKKQRKMKMMILKQGRIGEDVNNFHYFPDKSTEKMSYERHNTSKKSLKNSKSRTRYAEYNEKDETIDYQICKDEA